MPLTENLWRDTLADLELKPPVSVPPHATVRDALATMRASRTGCLFVVDNDQLVGVFTERDFVKRVIGQATDMSAMIDSVMTARPMSAGVGESVGDVLMKMRQGGYRHLPVVDPRGRLTGRVSVREIVHYMVEHFPKVVYNLPPREDELAKTAEGA